MKLTLNIKRIVILAVIVMMALSALVMGCADDREVQFKKIAKELRSELLLVESVEPNIYRDEADGNVMFFDFTERLNHVDNNRSKFDAIADELEMIAMRNEDSIWKDDAAFLLAMEHISISMPGGDYHDKAIEKINLFLTEYPSFHIEDWTKRYFNKVTIFHVLNKDKISDEDLFVHEGLDLTVNERIEAFFLFQLVNEHLKGSDADGALDGAKKEFERIRPNIKYEWLNENIRQVLKAYEEYAVSKQ